VCGVKDGKVHLAGDGARFGSLSMSLIAARSEVRANATEISDKV
jgi:hypothetical protein